MLFSEESGTSSATAAPWEPWWVRYNWPLPSPPAGPDCQLQSRPEERTEAAPPLPRRVEPGIVSVVESCSENTLDLDSDSSLSLFPSVPRCPDGSTPVLAITPSTEQLGEPGIERPSLPSAGDCPGTGGAKRGSLINLIKGHVQYGHEMGWVHPDRKSVV